MWDKEAALQRADELLRNRSWKRVLVAYYILLILSEESAYGNLLTERISERTDGVYIPNPNEMYPVLQELEKWNIIEGDPEKVNTRRKRMYKITEYGYEALPYLQEYLQKWYLERQQFWETISVDLYRELPHKK